MDYWYEVIESCLYVAAGKGGVNFNNFIYCTYYLVLLTLTYNNIKV